MLIELMSEYLSYSKVPVFKRNINVIYFFYITELYSTSSYVNYYIKENFIIIVDKGYNCIEEL